MKSSTEVAIDMPDPSPTGSHVHPSIAELLAAPDHIRVKAIIEDRRVLYPALKQVVNEAEWMIFEPRQTRARGLVVCADRGNGKTSLAHLIHQRYCDYDRSDTPCVLKISMSGTRDARSVYGRIMEALGSPARISHRLSDRELLVQRLLRDANCKMVILDEVQDILQGSEREQLRALEGIKLLMNELMVNILAFGTDRAAHGFRSDPHLAARFVEFTMPSWKADAVLANFLATYERLLPLRKPSNLCAQDKVVALAKFGNGVLGTIVERVKNAALAAIANGSECISRELIVSAVGRPSSGLMRDKGVLNG